MYDLLKQRFTILTLSLVLPVALVGCGGSEESFDEYSSFFETMIQSIDQMTAEFNAMKDDRTTATGANNIVAQCNSLSAHLQTASDISKPDAATASRIREQYESEWDKQLKRSIRKLERAAREAEKRVGRHRALRQVELRMDAMRQQLEEFEQGYRSALGV